MFSASQQEVETPMDQKLENIEEQVALEKKKNKSCREATRRSLATLYELLNEESEETSAITTAVGGE